MFSAISLNITEAIIAIEGLACITAQAPSRAYFRPHFCPWTTWELIALLPLCRGIQNALTKAFRPPLLPQNCLAANHVTRNHLWLSGCHCVYPQPSCSGLCFYSFCILLSLHCAKIGFFPKHFPLFVTLWPQSYPLLQDKNIWKEVLVLWKRKSLFVLKWGNQASSN